MIFLIQTDLRFMTAVLSQLLNHLVLLPFAITCVAFLCRIWNCSMATCIEVPNLRIWCLIKEISSIDTNNIISFILVEITTAIASFYNIVNASIQDILGRIPRLKLQHVWINDTKFEQDGGALESSSNRPTIVMIFSFS